MTVHSHGRIPYWEVHMPLIKARTIGSPSCATSAGCRNRIAARSCSTLFIGDTVDYCSIS